MASGWTWDETEQTYRNDDTGELLALVAFIALRDAFADKSDERMRSLTSDFVLGVITFAVWQAGMIALIRSITISQYALAVGGVTRLTTSMMSEITRIAGKHLGYFKRFVGEIAKGGMTAQAISAEAILYADAGIEAFEQARAASFGLFLPTIPPAHPRCRCWTRYGKDETGYYVAWITSADERVCVVCSGIESQYGMGNPYRGKVA